MPIFLSALPLWQSGLLVVALPTALAIAGSMLVRRRFGLERLSVNNEVAGFKFAVIGVIYAVLLGFAVIVVWEKFRDAEAAVTQEAAAVVTIDRLSHGLSPATGLRLRQEMRSYVEITIKQDWPAMERGETSAAATQALDRVYDGVLAAAPANASETAVFSEILERLDSLTSGRRTRLLLATGVVPAMLWAVLFTGALVTLLFTFFFGVPSAGSQVIMTGMLAGLIFMALFVAIEIDHPFTGPFSVGPEAIILAVAGPDEPS